MKKVILSALFGLSLSLVCSATNYSGTFVVSTGAVTQTQQPVNCNWDLNGFHFNQVGDSVSRFFEKIDTTLAGVSTISGSQYMSPYSKDSVATVSYTIIGLLPGHRYKIVPHIVVYQNGKPVWFANGAPVYFTTACNTPTIAITGPVNSICAGTSTALIASGAQSYLWNNGAVTASITVSPSSTTVYSVVGSNGICESIAFAKTVNVSGSIHLVVSPDITICNGGSTTLNANGGSSYAWSNGVSGNINIVTPSVTTTYSVTATSGSCVDVDQVKVTVSSGTNVSAVALVSTICKGSSTILTANGGTSWTWTPSASLDDPNSPNPVATPLVTTKYTVSSTDGTCASTSSATIVVDSLPQETSVSFNSVNGLLTINGQNLPKVISVLDLTTGFTYFDNYKMGTGTVKFRNTAVANGDDMQITTEDGCSVTFTANFSTTGIDVLNDNAVVVKHGEVVYLYDLTGRIINSMVAEKDYEKKELYLVNNSFTNLPAGVYIWATNSQQVSQKFVVK